MIKNYLKIALNNIVGHKLFSIINILGLTIGLTCSLLIGLFVIDELSYDKTFVDAERIYRVSRYFNAANGNSPMDGPANAPQVAPLLKENYFEVEQVARIIDEEVLVSYGDSSFYEAGFRLADNSFFEIFNFEWIHGDSTTALLEPLTVVLTESTAEKYFGSKDPMGETLLIENQAPLRVTGVIRDLPRNIHLTADLIASLNTIPLIYGEEELNSWGSNNYHTYIRLKPGENIESLESQFPDFINTYYQENSSSRNGMKAINLVDIHLRGGHSPFSPAGNINTVYAFISIALCILLIATINFMNLSTAKASKRALEVGMRISIGAQREQIIRQFLGESLLFSMLSMMMALVAVEMSLPWFNTLVGKELDFSYFTEPGLLLGLLSIVILVGLVAGSYPALYISSHRPAKTLKGDLSRGSRGLTFRNILVIFQFSISTVLIISTVVVFSQMRFAEKIELGFDKELVVILTGAPTERLGSQWLSMKRRLLEHPNISLVTASKRIPGEENLDSTGVQIEGLGEGRSMPFNPISFDFFKTYDVNIVSGRTFNADIASDRLAPPIPGEVIRQGAFIINEAAALQYGWSDDEAVGKGFSFAGNQGVVIGVIEDVYFETVRNEIRPMFYFIAPLQGQGPESISLRHASIKVSEKNLEATLSYIDEVWSEFMPSYPVSRHFLDTDFEVLYSTEQQQGDILKYFSILAILIACFGLFGLSSFNAESRVKEIGVRKVMGGTVMQIVILLTNSFSKLVLISNLIAWPVAYYAMNRWLENFAYRIDLSPIIFIGSGLIALCIAWVTVGGTAAKAASQKPVLALRYE